MMDTGVKAMIAEKRERVWLSPCPGVRYPAVVVWRRWGFVRIIAWGCSPDGERHFQHTMFFPSADLLSPRNEFTGHVNWQNDERCGIVKCTKTN